MRCFGESASRAEGFYWHHHIEGDEHRKCSESLGSTDGKHWQRAGRWNERDWSKVTPRLRTEEYMVIEQPLRSTDEGKVKLDLEELIRIISVLSSLSSSLLIVIQDLS